ncbi:MAG TPA: WhiB family transcriptional regulator [Ilumatobacteraceae bacterium]|jgi:WhiB family redox-sensing transcriptional regulator
MVARRDDEFDDLQWQQQATCRGDHAGSFYPPSHFERKDLRLARERLAKSICSQCPVRQACLGYAMRTAEPHGIWGGLNELERRELADRQS